MSPYACLALGTAQLGMAYGVANRAGMLSDEDARALLSTALELGIACIDTAPAYGSSEQRVGSFLRASHAKIRVVTKLSPLPAGITAKDIDAHVDAGLRASLEALGVSSVYALLLHAASTLEEHGSALLEALERQKALGRIEHLGLSVYDPVELELMRDQTALTAIQFPFNLFDRRFGEPATIPAWRKEGRVAFARSSMLQGLFALDPADLPSQLAHARPWLDRLHSALRDFGLDPISTALDFARAESGADYVVVGAETPEQLRGWVSASTPSTPERREQLKHLVGVVPAEIFDPRRWKAGPPT